MKGLKKVAIVTTHPIQYYAPLFRLLAERNHFHIKVFYTWGNVSESKHDPGFGKEIIWDIPLLEGYDYTLVRNTSSKPGSHHFWGIKNPTLRQDIESWGANAVLIFGWSYYSHLRALIYFKGKIPVFFRGDSHLLDETKNIKRLLRRLFLTWVYSHVDIALYVGQRNKEYFLTHGLQLYQLVWAPHSIDNRRFTHQEENAFLEADQWRQELNIPPQALAFIFAGKLEPKKDPTLLLEAFIQLNNREVFLIFVGNGILEQALKEKAQHIPNVRFLDFRNQKQMPVVYRLGAIFVLPSRGPGETWGLAINEAMACKRVILVSDKVGSAIDLVQNNKNGYTFRAGDVADLQHKMQHLIEMADSLKEMGQNSAHIITEWSIEKTADTIQAAVLKGIMQ